MMQIIKNLIGRFGFKELSHTDIPSTGVKEKGSFYLLITIAISFTAFWRFTYTYFAPVIAGNLNFK